MKYVRHTILVAITLLACFATPMDVEGGSAYRTLYLCYNFGPDFDTYDKPILEAFIGKQPCLQEWVNLVLVPYNVSQCQECRNTSRKLGIKCECMSEQMRLDAGLKHAPSYSLEDPRGRSLLMSSQTAVPLSGLSEEWLIPQGTVSIVHTPGRSLPQLYIQSNLCPPIRHRVLGDTVISGLPVGRYSVTSSSRYLTTITVSEYETTQLTIKTERPRKETPTAKPSVTPPVVRKPPVRERSYSWHGGLSAGLCLLPIEFEHQSADAFAIAGGSIRYTGAFAIDVSFIFGDSNVARGGIISLECTAYKNDWFELMGKFGYLSFDPERFIGYTLGEIDHYSEWFFGTSIFLGSIGYGRDHRFGVAIDVIDIRNKDYYSSDVGKIHVGDMFYAARLQWEIPF